MRVRMKLHFAEKRFFFPFNYKYEMSSVIYRNIERINEQFSQELHSKGFLYEGKSFKLFTHSDIRFQDFRATKHGIYSLSNKAEWLISSPVEKLFDYCLLGSLENAKLRLVFKERSFDAYVEQVEILPSPEFSEAMYFTCLSPIYTDTIRENPETGQRRFNSEIDYFKEKEKFTENLEQNLKRKYQLIFGQPAPQKDFFFEFNPHYIAKKKGRISVLTKYKSEKASILAWKAPCFIQAHPDLIRIAYECGLGSKNSNGFGMIEVDSSKNRQQKTG